MARSLDDVRCALRSIYFYSWHTSAEWLPEAMRPLAVERAGEILAADQSAVGRSRRRRAIAVLFAAVPHAIRQRGLASLEAGDEVDYLKDAKTATDPAARHEWHGRFLQRLAVLDRAFPGTSHRPPVSPEAFDFQYNSWQTMSWVLDVLVDRFGPVLGCTSTAPVTTVNGNPDGSYTVVATMSVERRVDALRRALDPQSWATCGPELWEAAYVAMKDASGSYPIDAQFNALREPNPPPVGDAWRDVLFEHVALGIGKVIKLAEARILLNVDIEYHTTVPPRYQLEFELRRSIHSRLGFWAQAGGVEIDEGTLVAAECGTASCIELKKTVKLRAPFWLSGPLNYALGEALHLLGDGLSEWVCCETP